MPIKQTSNWEVFKVSKTVGRTLLQHGELTIAEVAASLGFCDRSHFTRYFKRIVGATPKQLLQP